MDVFLGWIGWWLLTADRACWIHWRDLVLKFCCPLFLMVSVIGLSRWMNEYWWCGWMALRFDLFDELWSDADEISLGGFGITGFVV